MRKRTGGTNTHTTGAPGRRTTHPSTTLKPHGGTHMLGTFTLWLRLIPAIAMTAVIVGILAIIGCLWAFTDIPDWALLLALIVGIMIPGTAMAAFAKFGNGTTRILTTLARLGGRLTAVLVLARRALALHTAHDAKVALMQEEFARQMRAVAGEHRDIFDRQTEILDRLDAESAKRAAENAAILAEQRETNRLLREHADDGHELRADLKMSTNELAAARRTVAESTAAVDRLVLAQRRIAEALEAAGGPLGVADPAGVVERVVKIEQKLAAAEAGIFDPETRQNLIEINRQLNER